MKRRCKTGSGKDLGDVGAVCDECAESNGFSPKDKVVGVWMDRCGICGRKRPCTDLWHDWERRNGDGVR